MLIQLNQKQLKLQNELQEYFEALITPSLRAELSQPEYFEGGGPEFKKAISFFVEGIKENKKSFYKTIY